MKLLFEGVVDINAVGEDDCTALHTAAMHGTLNTVECLLSMGARTNAIHGGLGTL